MAAAQAAAAAMAGQGAIAGQSAVTDSVPMPPGMILLQILNHQKSKESTWRLELIEGERTPVLEPSSPGPDPHKCHLGQGYPPHCLSVMCDV